MAELAAGLGCNQLLRRGEKTLRAIGRQRDWK